MMTDWSARTWFITGSSAGFGRTIAEAVLARGGRVVATARNPATLADLVAGAGDRAIALPLDVTKPDQIADAVAQAEAWGGIDVLVNNAGYGFISGIEEASDAEVRAQFETNFFGLAALTRAVLPGMRARRSGFVINLSSIAGIAGNAATGYYSATKFAVEGLTESLAKEGAPLGIRAMIVEPGAFRTDFAGRSIRVAADAIEDYAEVISRKAMLAGYDGTQAGDPVRAAEAIIAAVESETPPLRLLLGRVASETARTVHAARLAEAEAGHERAVAADYPEG